MATRLKPKPLPVELKHPLKGNRRVLLDQASADLDDMVRIPTRALAAFLGSRPRDLRKAFGRRRPAAGDALDIKVRIFEGIGIYSSRPYTYTVGFTRLHWPELLCIGPDDALVEDLYGVLRDLSRMAALRGAPYTAERELWCGCPIVFFPFSPSIEYPLTEADRLFGCAYRVLRVLPG